MNKKLAYLSSAPLLALLLSSPATVLAETWAERTTISGVLSTVYSQTGEEAYFDGNEGSGINKDGGFKGTKLGITINSQVTDDLKISMLLMSAADHDNYLTGLDWGFASFSLTDEFTARVGRIKLPVGLVNEYVEVGVAYPWISPPQLIYSKVSSGPQATRESYSGGSMIWEGDFDDWMLSGDLFFGQVNLGDIIVNGMTGATIRANWDDIIELQASSYQGKMSTSVTTTPTSLMDEKVHSAMLIGLKADWNDIVLYTEAASVKMDVTLNGNNIGDSDSWYATLGYRMGDFLPHITRQEWERDNGNNQKISTLGVTYALSDSTVIKLEQSRIEIDNLSASNTGLFNVAPENDTVNLTRVAVEVVF